MITLVRRVWRFALRRRGTLAVYLVLLLLAFYALAPLMNLAFNSLKATAEVAANPFGFPKTLRWSNYSEAWRLGKFSTTLRNSVILTVVSVSGVLVIAFLAAYALARYSPPGYNFFVSYILLGSTIPSQLYIVPLFIMWSRLGLMDNLLGLSLVFIANHSPFAAFLVRAFLLGVSSEFEDAARVDGASEWQVLTRILVPMSWPVLLTVALVTGVRVWNNFFFAVTLIQDEAWKPVSTSLSVFQQKYDTNWGLINAAAVITVLPVLLMFVIFQRQFIAGLTQGGLKG